MLKKVMGREGKGSSPLELQAVSMNRQRLLSRVLLIDVVSQVPVSAIALFFPSLLEVEVEARLAILVAFACTVISWRISLSRHRDWACLFLTLTSALCIATGVIRHPIPTVIAGATNKLNAIMLICGLVLPLRRALGLGLIMASIFPLAHYWVPDAHQSLLSGQLLSFLSVATISIIGGHFRNLAEAAARESNLLLQGTFDHASVGIFRASTELKILWANPTCCKLLGYSEEEIPGMDLFDLVHPEDRESSEAVMRSLLSGQIEHREFDVRRLRKDGSSFWAHISTRLVRNEAGAPMYFVTITQDITERRRAERLIRDHQAQMVAASKMSALGEMSGAIAHEINNPLAIIQGRASQLRELVALGSPDPAQIERISERIELTAIRIAKIIKALRALSRDGSADPFELTPMSRILADASELCSERFKSHGMELRIEPVPDDLQIECRGVQIGQVLLNLLNNAHDALEKLDERWVSVTVHDLGESVEFAVTDGGKGVPAELRDRILQPFFTTKEVGKGTGLGLSISRNIAEGHGGRLFLDTSCPNTRFVVQLPKFQGAVQRRYA